MIKYQLRQRCIKKRISLGQDYITDKSEIITSKFLASDDYKNSESIFIYISTDYEVNTKQIIKQSLQDNKTVLVPVLINKTEMAAAKIDSNTIFIKNRYNIDEPREKNIYNKKTDIVVCPGLCFSENGDRIGYGGGFYDRFLEKHKYSVKIGLSFDEFIYNTLPIEQHDIKMDIIITPSKTINIK